MLANKQDATRMNSPDAQTPERGSLADTHIARLVRVGKEVDEGKETMLTGLSDDDFISALIAKR